jgi:hypothetical protein
MIERRYAKAYTEVLEIISYFPREEYLKIPEERIQFYKNNMDPNYSFKINPLIDLSCQNISCEANAIIITLFRDYFANEEQKIKIKERLILNQNKKEEEKRKIYNPEDLFKQRKQIEENIKLTEYKENLFARLKKYIFSLLYNKNNNSN